MGENFRGKRILVVDDDATTLKALFQLLGFEGYEVEVSANPVQALETLRASAPDILLTDQVMGGMRGLELARQALAAHPAIRCFVMSGQNAPAAAECAHVTWIKKPLDIDVLLEMLAGR